MPLAFMKEGMSNRRVAGLLFLEAAVIFLGITSSFWIEEWRQNREDLDTYHHLLEEIYYNAVIDEATVPLSIAANNLALKDALELTVLNSSELADDELFGRLDHIFVGSDWYSGSFNPAGYVRLSNTPLSIPFDETLLSLDNLFASLDGLQISLRSVGDQIGELGAHHWRMEGLISCTGAASNDGTTILMDRPYMAEIRKLMYPGGECIAELENRARAAKLLDKPDFQNAVRQVIEALADADRVLEMGVRWGPSMITSLATLDGRPVGVLANQPLSPVAGAIDVAAADKAARFIELCDAYEFPIVSLVDNPGYMVGPDTEREGIAPDSYTHLRAHETYEGI